MNSGFQKQDFQGALVALAHPALARAGDAAGERHRIRGLYTAMDFIESGRGRVALVVGAEDERAPDVRGWRYPAQRQLPQGRGRHRGRLRGRVGRIASAYFERYGDQGEALARIAAKNHRNGVDNPMRRSARTWVLNSATP